jgi:hypothetical protein
MEVKELIGTWWEQELSDEHLVVFNPINDDYLLISLPRARVTWQGTFENLIIELTRWTEIVEVVE